MTHMKLAYIANKINGTSGLQRMITLQINYFIVNYNYEIDLLLLEQDESEDKNFFELDKEVGLHYLKHYKNHFIRVYSKVKGLNRTLEIVKPDIVIVCESDIFSLYLPRFVSRKFKMVYQRHDTKQLNLKSINSSVKSIFLNKLKKLLLTNAGGGYDKFVLLSDAHRLDWKNLKSIEIISNPIIIDTKGVTAKLEKKQVLAVGRHDYVKGFDMLLNCWQKVTEKYPDWKLKIVGKRNSNIDLISLAKNLNIYDKVIFEGETKDISKVYLESSIYACSSRLEGFPLVIIEAMSFGLPVVSFECKYGPREIVMDSVDGILVPQNNIGLLADSLSYLISNVEIRKQMGKKASENIKRYSVEKIMNQWKTLFEGLMQNSYAV